MSDPTCSFPGCTKSAKGNGCARGFCNNHYVQWHQKHRHEITKPRPKTNTGPCSVDGCARDAHTRGMCQMHYKRLLYKGDVGPIEPLVNLMRGAPPAERFWARVEKTSTCWLWRGALDRKGYGHIKVGSKGMPAHRYAYELLVGSIPDGLTIDHLCRNPSCVNPTHLEPVTARENSLRAVEARRICVHCGLPN